MADLTLQVELKEKEDGTSILIGFTIGFADLSDGDWQIVGSGKTLRFRRHYTDDRPSRTFDLNVNEIANALETQLLEE